MKIQTPEENLINILIGTILNSTVSEIEVEYSTVPVLKDEKNDPGYVLTGIKSIKFEFDEKKGES